MISTISKGEKGISEYLRTGKKRGSLYSRDEKDRRVAILGNLEMIADSEKYQIAAKNQKFNYYHSTMSFLSEEYENLKNSGKLEELVKDYIRANFPNHNDDEFIAYAEAHEPIIQSEPYIARSGKGSRKLNEKYEDKNIGRSNHIHIIVSMENARFSGPIRTGGLVYSKKEKRISPSAALKFKKICDELLCRKYGLVSPEPLKISDSELKTQYEKYVQIAKKVSKGKAKILQTPRLEGSGSPALSGGAPADDALSVGDVERSNDVTGDQIQNSIKGITMKEIRQNVKNSPIAAQIAENHIEPQQKSANTERAMKIKAADVALFVEALREKYADYTLGVDVEHNQLTFSTTTNAGKTTTKRLPAIDYLTKNCHRSFTEALDELESIAKQREIEVQKGEKIELSVSSDFTKLPSSTEQKPVYRALSNWQTIQINPKDIKNALSGYSAVSMARFSGTRKDANISGFTPTLIFDFDGKMQISEAKQMLANNGIAGYIYTSANHRKDGVTEKFRLIIPTSAAPTKETYKDYMQIIVNQLGIAGKIDGVAQIPAQLYFAPGQNAEFHAIKGDVFDTAEILRAAREKQAQAEAAVIAKADEIKLDVANGKGRLILTNQPQDNDQYLTRVDLQGLLNVPLLQVMQHFDPTTTIIKEGNSEILHNRDGRHLWLPDENAAYRFKEAKQVTPYIYLKEKFQAAREAIDSGVNDEIIEKIGIRPDERQNFNPDNINEIGKFFSRNLVKFWSATNKINYKGIASNIAKYMSNDFNDKQGIEQLKKHYGIEKFVITQNYLVLGYIKILKEKIKHFSKVAQEVEQKLPDDFYDSLAKQTQERKNHDEIK